MVDRPEPGIDVSIVAYNSAAVIASAISSARQRHVRNVIVVDHGEDGAGAIATAAGAVVVPAAANVGFGAGQNRAAGEATADFVLLLNPDATMRADALEHGLAVLLANPDAAAVQGAVVRPDGTVERSHGRALSIAHVLGRALGLRAVLRFRVVRDVARRVPVTRDHANRLVGAETDVDWMATTAVLVRREAFAGVGGFDERYFLYGEDFDLCRRLRRAGWRLIAVPGVWAVHTGGGSSADTLERELAYWSGMMRYVGTWWAPVPWMLAMVSAAVAAGRMCVSRPRQARAIARRMIVEPLRIRTETRPRFDRRNPAPPA